MFKKLKNRFLSESKQLSFEQLERDFEIYPPSPLVFGVSKELSFSVIKTKWLGDYYSNLFLVRLFYDSIKNRSTLEAGACTDPSLRELFNSVLAIRELIDKNNLIAYFALLIVMPYFVVRVIFGSRVAKNKVMGYFIKVPGLDDKIFIKDRGGSGASRFDAVITHEHLHFLQSKHLFRGHLNRPERYLREKYVSDRYALYILEQKEVEARLHELVLSYYRKKKTLPVTLDGFLNMFIAWDGVGSFIQNILEHKGFLFLHGLDCFAPRDELFCQDIYALMLISKDVDASFRFLTEVLPVMYGNLLLYYGDFEASEGFHRLISRPNLFDIVYG